MSFNSMHLIGADDVARAGRLMSEASASIRNSADSIVDSAERIERAAATLVEALASMPGLVKAIERLGDVIAAADPEARGGEG